MPKDFAEIRLQVFYRATHGSRFPIAYYQGHILSEYDLIVWCGSEGQHIGRGENNGQNGERHAVDMAKQEP